MVAQLNPDPAPSHLVRYRRRCGGAEKGIEHQVARIAGDGENSMKQALWLRCIEGIFCTEQVVDLLLRFLIMPGLIICPPRPRHSRSEERRGGKEGRTRR